VARGGRKRKDLSEPDEVKDSSESADRPSKRSRAKTLKTITVSFGKSKSKLTQSINLIRNTIRKKQKLAKYQMHDKQSATTTARHGDLEIRKSTSPDTMHAEMVAIKEMLDKGAWRLINGRIKTAQGHDVELENFSTDACHCGFCTIMLRVLGLPLGRPTAGNHILAGNDNYPLPTEIKYDPLVVVRVARSNLTDNAAVALREILSSFVPYKDDDWYLDLGNGTAEFNNGRVTIAQAKESGRVRISLEDFFSKKNSDEVNMLWKEIFGAIRTTNNQFAKSRDGKREARQEAESEEKKRKTARKPKPSH